MPSALRITGYNIQTALAESRINRTLTDNETALHRTAPGYFIVDNFLATTQGQLNKAMLHYLLRARRRCRLKRNAPRNDIDKPGRSTAARDKGT